MNDKLTLGQKLKFFRKDKGMSQSQLEVEAELEFGTVSRIENGKINPTKETITKIAQILKLSNDDLNYLFEVINSKPTQAEIDKAIAQIQPLLNQELFPAYIMDNRFRIWAVNKMILKLFGVKEDQTKGKAGINLFEVLFFMFGILSRIPKRKLIQILKEQISIFKQETGRYKEEGQAKELIGKLNKSSIFSKLWKDKKPYTISIRRAIFYFKYKRKILKILITRSETPIDQRFFLVEYFPMDKKTTEVFGKIRDEVKK